MALIGAFTYNRKLTYDTTTIRAHISANISDFPLCIAINQYSWSTSTDRDKFFDASNVGGKRIQFYDYDTTTNLAYEVEYYNATTQEAVYWVKVPTILHDGDANYATRNFIYSGYGNDPNSSDQDAPTSVWDSNFRAVHHLKDITPSTTNDSTSYANNGTKYTTNEPIESTGKVHKGQTFDGNNDYINLGNPSSLNIITSEITISAWIYLTQARYHMIATKSSNGTTNTPFEFRTNDSSTPKLQFNRGSAGGYSLKTAGTSLSLNTWYHVVATVDSSNNYYFYVNGVSDGWGVFAFNPTTTTSNCLIGRRNDGYTAQGIIDEVRISASYRTADWINLEYWSTKSYEYNGDGWLQWDGEPSNIRASYLSADVEYELQGNVQVASLVGEVEFDVANPSLQISGITGEVEYDTANPNLLISELKAEVEYYTSDPQLQVDTLHGEVEYDTVNAEIQLSQIVGEVEYIDSTHATPNIFTSQVCGEVEHDIIGEMQISEVRGEVEYDIVPQLCISRINAEVEYVSFDTPSKTQTFTNTILTGTVGSVQVTQTFINGFSTTSSFVNDWDNNVQWFINSILNDTTGVTQELSNSLLTYNPVATSQIISFSILSAYEFESMTPTYQILLDGIDISQKVLSCNITYNRNNFVGECSIVWKDWTIFNQIDCSDYTKNYAVERIEVKTRLLDTDDWTSHGTFYIEKRDTAMTVEEILPTSWGRNKPAILSEPFAQTITKTWDYDTTAKSIALEVINGLCELDWQIMDYPVYTGRFSANKERPIAIINRLAQVLGAIVTTDKSGRVRVIYEWQM